MEPTKKISYESLKDKMSETMLKGIIAGSGGSGSGSCQILECAPTCDAAKVITWVHDGSCWDKGMKECGCGFICYPCPF